MSNSPLADKPCNFIYWFISNGSRAEFFGSNPHSNGEIFSRSSLIFFEINVASIRMTVDSKMATIAVVVIIIIIYLAFTNFLIGSQVYFLY
jgi:hypothetical protein